MATNALEFWFCFISTFSCCSKQENTCFITISSFLRCYPFMSLKLFLGNSRRIAEAFRARSTWKHVKIGLEISVEPLICLDHWMIKTNWLVLLEKINNRKGTRHIWSYMYILYMHSICMYILMSTILKNTFWKRMCVSLRAIFGTQNSWKFDFTISILLKSTCSGRVLHNQRNLVLPRLFSHQRPFRQVQATSCIP